MRRARAGCRSGCGWIACSRPMSTTRWRPQAGTCSPASCNTCRTACTKAPGTSSANASATRYRDHRRVRAEHAVVGHRTLRAGAARPRSAVRHHRRQYLSRRHRARTDVLHAAVARLGELPYADREPVLVRRPARIPAAASPAPPATSRPPHPRGSRSGAPSVGEAGSGTPKGAERDARDRDVAQA